MLDVILDTDLGIDCDDAVALAILLKAEIAGKCRIKAITASTARVGATATADAICRYYGLHKPIARLTEPLDCDKVNSYARAVMEKYGTRDTEAEAVPLLRKTLAESGGGITFIAIGPLTNVARLFASGPDEFSPLDGLALFGSKVKKAFIMGGSFKENDAALGIFRECAAPEWNVMQDVSSAKYVLENIGVEAILVPHEAGFGVYTDMGEDDNPVWYSMEQYFLNNRELLGENGYRRHSWDPITCAAALYDLTEWFDLSARGKVSVDDVGRTVFSRGSGTCRFLMPKAGFLAEGGGARSLGEYINALMK